MDKEPVTLADIAYEADQGKWAQAAISPLRVKRTEAVKAVTAIDNEIHRLKKIAYPHKCCRCWPSMITDASFCTCCMYDHITNKSADVQDPDYGL